MPPPSQPPKSGSLQNEIPPLTTLLPAIFVPIPSSFFTYKPATTTTAQIRDSIAALDTHAAQVRSNILALSKQECRRIARDAEIQEMRMDSPPSVKGGMSEADRALLLANLQAPREKGPSRELPSAPDFSEWVVRSPAEWRDREILRTVARTMVELKGYGEHVKRTRDVYEEALEREMRKESEGEGGGSRRQK